MGSLDGLRLMSFLIIFIHHMPEPAAIQIFAQRGKIAVELFFVISAYLLFRLLEAEDHKEGRIDVRVFPVPDVHEVIRIHLRQPQQDRTRRLRELDTPAQRVRLKAQDVFDLKPRNDSAQYRIFYAFQHRHGHGRNRGVDRP